VPEPGRAFDRAHADAFARVDLVHAARRLFTELVGAFVLVSVEVGAHVLGAPAPARAVLPGLVVLPLVMAMGDVSGAHFNPAVTFAFALRRAFPWRLVPLYMLAQVGGAIIAASALRALLGPSAALATPHADVDAGVAFAVEAFLTAMLVMVVLGTATRHRVLGSNAAVAVGATLACAGLVAKQATTACLNPARYFGSALISGWLDEAGIYLIAPIAGALVATCAMHVIHYRKHDEEADAACGEPKRG
jgi:glycerol uptake facilitator-like aquaporin